MWVQFPHIVIVMLLLQRRRGSPKCWRGTDDVSISFSSKRSSLAKGSLHRPRGGWEINEDMPDLALLRRKKTKKQEPCSPPPPLPPPRSTVGFIARRTVEVSHRPEIKQAIIHILFGEGKIKVNLSFCSSWSSFGLGSVFSTWSRLRWLAGFWGSGYCFFALMVYLHLTSETSLRWKQDLTSSSSLLTCDAGCSCVSNAMQTS